MRARFPTWAVVALTALTVGALSIAVTLAASDANKWPGWLQPYHRWGWWSVLGLLAAAVALTVWQAARQPSTTPAAPSTVHAVQGSLAAARDMTITGAQGPTAGRDAQIVAGAAGTTVGGDFNITTITTTGPVTAPTVPPAAVVAAGPISNLPPRNLAFTGREDLLDRLHQQLTMSTAAAVTALADEETAPVGAAKDVEASRGELHAPRVLHGLGGVGKSQLATEYAYRHASDYRIRWWLPAEQPAAIPRHLVALARQLSIPEQVDQSQTIAVLLAELGRRGDWLLVFDNAEEPRDLSLYWPSMDHGGRVLVTSRNPNWQPVATPVPVNVLPRPDAIAFLQRRIGILNQDADQLAAALGDLPLALEQAAAYLEQTHTSPGEYLKLLATRAQELFALGRPATSEQTIATLWSLSLQRVHAEEPPAEELLRLCAFLAPDDIPRSLFEAHPDLLPEPLATAVHDRLAFQRAIGALRRYSLVSAVGDALWLHRLVQAIVRHSLKSEQAIVSASAAVRLVAAAFPDRAEYVETWPSAERLLPQALTAVEQATIGVEPIATVALLHRVGRYLSGRGDLGAARPLHERALAIREARLGPDHPDTAASLNNLAVALRDQGDLGAARPLLERALAIREARLGPDHHHTARSLSNLASVLVTEGDLDRAHAHLERALAIYTARFGTYHPATAQSLNDLATVLRYQGDLAGARAVLERVLAIREARLGPDHPATAQSLSNLATVLAGQGDLHGACTRYGRALAIYEVRVGPDHPDTIRSREQLSAVVAMLENRSSGLTP